MNCEKCQDLISDLLDGSINHQDRAKLSSHLEECLHCAEVRDDLQSIVGFCRTQRGQYAAPPNEQALWLRIRNMIEAGASADTPAPAATRSVLSNWTARSWELSFPQLAAMVAAIVLIVSLSTAVGLRRWQSGAVDAKVQSGAQNSLNVGAIDVRNLAVIDQAVNDSFDSLSKNPHDEVSEEMLNTALNEKLSLLKEFAEL